MAIRAFIMTPNSIVLTLVDGTVETVPSTHPHYDAIVASVRADGYEAEVEGLISIKHMVINAGAGRVEIRDGVVFFDGKELEHDVLTDFMVKMVQDGFDIGPFANFLVRLQANPSFNSRRGLFAFMQANGLTVDPEGYILAYKGVNDDYTDCHTGKIDNRIGAVIPPMDRSQIDDNPDNHCSFGYHAGGHAYVCGFGVRKMLVKVDPANVVCVPNDANAGKMRVTVYEVIGEVDREHFQKPFLDRPVYSDGYEEETFEDEDETFRYKVTLAGLTADGLLVDPSYIVRAIDEDDAKQQALELVENWRSSEDDNDYGWKVKAIVRLD